VSLRDKLAAEMKKALKGGQKARLSAMRLLKAELEVAEASGKAFSEVDVARSYAKKLHKVAEEYAQLGVADRAQAARADAQVVEEFLPPQMSRPELERLVADLISQNQYGQPDLGKVMKEVMSRHGDVVDGQTVREIATQQLSERA
jgi:uncharacterized protein YqeY